MGFEKLYFEIRSKCKFFILFHLILFHLKQKTKCNFVLKAKYKIKDFYMYISHTAILPDWTFKKWGHSNFAFQHCNALLGIHWHPIQKEFLKSCEEFMRAALTVHGHPSPVWKLAIITPACNLKVFWATWLHLCDRKVP